MASAAPARLADLEFGERFRCILAWRAALDSRGRGLHLPAMTRPDLMAMAAARAGPVATIGRWGPPKRVHVYWAIFTLSVLCFVLGQMLGAHAGGLAVVLAIGGVAGCGWSWLLTRALFQPGEHEVRWPRIVVAIVLVTGVISILAEATPHMWAEPFVRVSDNVLRLTSSTVLLLAFVEPLNGYRRDLPPTERRFRALFAAGYAGLVAISVLWLRSGGDAPAAEAIKTACALAALALGGLAVWFRDRHPLAAAPGPAKKRAVAVEEEDVIARAILRVLREEALYTTPNLKVADLARRVGQPDHKVSACITGALGYANFNRLMNHFRIERAKRLLADPARADQQILSIALECGFASIGPFNRAFKEATGASPRAYRAAAPAPDGRDPERP
ncbi:MAG: helix-turn-helix domain-containing protein [Alphaproteobacteria bacterium]|nr:helix-turn-helix domain-containing protein [Alphaproteobacteria bacterium]